MKTLNKKVVEKKVKKADVKKASVKKVVVKKSIKKPIIKKPDKPKAKTLVTKEKITTRSKKLVKKNLVEASDYNSFWLNDGQILNSLPALAEVLKSMDSAVYKYHTANGRHDFANWVEDVLQDAECATALRKNKTPASARKTVLLYLTFYFI